MAVEIYNQVPEAILCLKTAVRNNSGKKMTFSYLPPHGVTLDDGEEYIVDGNLLQILGQGRPHQTKRKLDALLSDLQDGTLVILHTPQQHFYDDALEAVKVLKIHGGAAIVDDPCWGRYVSSHGIDEGAE